MLKLFAPGIAISASTCSQDGSTDLAQPMTVALGRSLQLHTVPPAPSACGTVAAPAVAAVTACAVAATTPSPHSARPPQALRQPRRCPPARRRACARLHLQLPARRCAPTYR
eukprot:TRINITY_DN141_c0_g2_i2.p2 TRINITY_DN141_c0_g2~~TRINITY_DN141_c0_g2_i2.p2  ORF type:complete len:112 (+),score=8.17 TRINITY_DN141_c0_g2_i2:806-1141(+)